jgi:hypothetical protein
VPDGVGKSFLHDAVKFVFDGCGKVEFSRRKVVSNFVVVRWDEILEDGSESTFKSTDAIEPAGEPLHLSDGSIEELAKVRRSMKGFIVS